jgi:hypothetical protein
MLLEFQWVIPVPSNSNPLPKNWQRNCSYPCSLLTKKPVGGGEKLKNFDEWTEELSKTVFAQVDEDDGKGLLKAEEILVDDDLDEE